MTSKLTGDIANKVIREVSKDWRDYGTPTMGQCAKIVRAAIEAYMEAGPAESDKRPEAIACLRSGADEADRWVKIGIHDGATQWRDGLEILAKKLRFWAVWANGAEAPQTEECCQTKYGRHCGGECTCHVCAPDLHDSVTDTGGETAESHAEAPRKPSADERENFEKFMRLEFAESNFDKCPDPRCMDQGKHYREEFVDAAWRIWKAGAEVSQHPVPAPQQFKHYPKPWEFREEGCNGGPGVFDAAGSSIVALFWPFHPVEETAEAEQETYALGRAIAEIGKGEHPVPASETQTQGDNAELVRMAEKLLEWMPIYSKGSSGHIRQMNLRAAIDKLKAEPVESLSAPQGTPECSCECWRCKGEGHCVRCNWGGNTAELGTCKVHQGHHRLLTSWNRETGCVEWTVLTPEEKFGWPLSGTGILIHGKHYTQRDPVGCEICKSEDAKPVGSEVKPRTGDKS